MTKERPHMRSALTISLEKVYVFPAFLGGKAFNRNLKERWTKMEKMFKDLGVMKEAATQPY